MNAQKAADALLCEVNFFNKSIVVEFTTEAQPFLLFSGKHSTGIRKFLKQFGQSIKIADLHFAGIKRAFSITGVAQPVRLNNIEVWLDDTLAPNNLFQVEPNELQLINNELIFKVDL